MLLSQASSTRQVLTLQVAELNKIGIVGSNFTLVVDAVNPRTLDFIPALNTSTILVWTSNGENKKITVANSLNSPKFPLKLIAEKISANKAVGSSEVKLSDNATRDLIVGLGRSAGRCEIRFAATAGPEHGVGSETHTITFTITGS